MSDHLDLPQSLYKVTEIEIVYRNPVKLSERPIVRSSKEASAILRQVWDDNKIDLLEQFKIMLLDRNGACLGVCDIATGGIAFCPVDAKVILATALKAKASAIILAHNHPSGNTKASHYDFKITSEIKKMAELIGIPVNDHIILTREDYSSYADGWKAAEPQNQLF